MKRFKKPLKTIQKLKSFDYADLSFLYIACLVSIALVYSLFRASQSYLNRQEARALETIEEVARRHEHVSELERLIAFAQNRTAPQYDVTVRLLTDTYRGLAEQHVSFYPKLEFLGRRCTNRPCEVVFQTDFFDLSPAAVEKELMGNTLSLADHNRILQKLFDLSVRYHSGLKDTMSVSFGVIRAKNSTKATFDFFAYLSLIALLLIQALYVFRPAIRRLNASLSTRSDFMSRISHEIRNPMNSIIGMADILKSTKLNSEQQHYVDNLIRSGHALLDLLNNLVDSSAIERGKLNLKPESFDLFRSLDRSLNLVAIQANHKNINLYLHMSPEVPAALIGDSVRLEQILVNLLSNAVKFTEQGHVTLDIQAVNSGDDQTELKFSVSDSGIGIKAEILPDIFDSFVQADSSIQRKYGGSGLGLSISSELIRMMGGELKVESEYGQGSRFYFTVSLRRQSARNLEVQPLTILQSRKFILLVSIAESTAYKKFFDRLQSPATLLHSSQELRGLVSSGSAGSVYQVLIDDSIGIISMINCRNLADEAGWGESAVALIRSGFTKENMDLLKRNGFQRFIIKPLKPWEVLTLPPPMSDEATSHTQTQNLDVVHKLKEKNLRILLVDDSNDNLFLLKEVVNPLASVVHFAENGLEALEKFARNTYDVVFMDIQMPVMDGYTAIRKMREFESKTRRSIPIFAVTAHAGLVDAQKCIEAGFTNRIVKPVVRSDIYLSLSKAFSLELSEMKMEEGAGMPAKYLAKLLPGFIKTRAEDMKKLKAAVEQGDFHTISQLGHKMKGSSASYGFIVARDLSARLEQAAGNQQMLECAQLTHQLEDVFADIGRSQSSPSAPL